jgi:hypothetical protein
MRPSGENLRTCDNCSERLCRTVNNPIPFCAGVDRIDGFPIDPGSNKNLVPRKGDFRSIIDVAERSLFRSVPVPKCVDIDVIAHKWIPFL